MTSVSVVVVVALARRRVIMPDCNSPSVDCDEEEEVLVVVVVVVVLVVVVIVVAVVFLSIIAEEERLSVFDGWKDFGSVSKIDGSRYRFRVTTRI